MNSAVIFLSLSGTIGTTLIGWPSVDIRGMPATPSAVLDQQIKPIEQRGCCGCFKWDRKTQLVEAIDTLQPFYTAEVPRPA